MFDVAAFGSLVRRKRGELKITQETLASDVFGDSTRKGDISRIENGKTTPQEATVQKLCAVLNISDAEMEPIRQSRPAAEQLANIPTLNREELQNLAARFGIDQPFDLSDSELRRLLTQKAEEYRSYKTLIDGLDERVAAIANLKGAAQHAAEQLNFEEVEMLLARVDEVETTIAAETKEARASNALLRNRTAQAFAIYESAANGFAELDVVEYANRRNTYFTKLFNHGLRYGGLGVALSVDIIRPAITALKDTAHREEWAGYTQNLALALQEQGIRTDGTAGAKLLAQAVAAYRDALIVFTRADHPVHWAMTTQNLAVALQDQGIRTDGTAGTKLLAQAVTAYRDALTIRTRADHPVDWAMTTQNLAGALENQGIRTDGPDGTALLAEAVTAYRDALTVYTRADHPVHWATTTQNLAAALQTQGIRTDGTAGTKLLADAVTAYRDALTVRTREDHPVRWAMTQENIAIAERATAQHAATSDPEPHWTAALKHVDAALEVYDPVHMPYDHGTATKLRAAILART